MENIKAVAEFMEVLMNNPKQAYDFISMNYCKMDKSDLAALVKVLLLGIYNDCHPDLMQELHFQGTFLQQFLHLIQHLVLNYFCGLYQLHVFLFFLQIH